MVTWRVIAPAVVSTALFCGCDAPPPGIIPAAPPGTELQRKAPDSEQPAEALGEQAPKAGSRAMSTPPSKAAAIEPALPTAKGETKTTASGVKYETIRGGEGPEAKAGQTVKVHYTGTLENGKEFDSSRRPGREPFSFTIGAGQVIRGWDEGVAGMKAGEQRKLTIPAAAAYGEQGKGDIPPNSTLLFDIELLNIE